MKRMNVMVDDEALKDAMRELGETTASGTINKALAETARKLTVRRLIREVAGTGWDGDLEEMRRGRTFDDWDVKPVRKRVAAKTVSAPKANRGRRNSR